jgi:deoxyribodipyrimidine photo-lyase
MNKLSLFIFRQDLRLKDNTALLEAIQSSETVLPIFIHDTRAIEDFRIDDPRFGYIREALEAIDLELQKYGGKVSVYQ